MIYKRYNFFKTLTELTINFLKALVGSFQRAPNAARASAHDLRLLPATRLSPLVIIIIIHKINQPFGKNSDLTRGLLVELLVVVVELVSVEVLVVVVVDVVVELLDALLNLV